MKLKMLPAMIVAMVFCGMFTGCGSKPAATEQKSSAVQTNKVRYVDGTYEGKSSPTSEGYYAKAKVTIKDSKISTVDFEIYDTTVFKVYGNSKHKDAEELLLDESYGAEVYEEMPLYQQQTKNELLGMKSYKSELVKEQDVDKVDAVSGATWSYQLFQETLKSTLTQAEKK